MRNGKYAIAKEDLNDYALQFFYDNLNGCIILTRIAPTMFPNKKKAKRVLKRLNKYHGGGYFLFNYKEALRYG
ncbi:MAG: hypothetical protein ABS939_08345 [Psychrobacillus sp.]